jgi:hypothetical protein
MHELKSDDATVSGEAAVIRAADKLQAQPAVLRATVHVTRAGTGKVDTFEIVGTPEPLPPEPPKEI